MGSRPLKINKNFGKPVFNITGYKLAEYNGSQYLVENIFHNNEVRIKADRIGEFDMTGPIIRQLKSKTWNECIVPQCIAEYLLNYDPTCFRSVEELSIIEDDYFEQKEKTIPKELSFNLWELE